MTSSASIYLAPFQGITTYEYREVYTRYFRGVDKLFTPFFTGNSRPKSLEKRTSEFNYSTQNNIEVVPQILSKDSVEIISFANFCEQKGFKEINWNLGCPYPRVANKKRGSGMLPYPDMVKDILEQVMPNIRIKLSIKCRLGYFSEEEIIKLIETLNLFEVYEITIHARLGKQLYKGNVNIDAFDSAQAVSKIPVAYNGDIFSTDDYKQISERLPNINTWMIGRGLLIDPFLPDKIFNDNQIIDANSQKEIVFKFVTDLYLAYRKKTNDRLQAIGIMKELWHHMSYSFSNPNKVFNTIKKTTSFDKYETAVSHVFDNYDWIGGEGNLFNKSLKNPLF